MDVQHHGILLSGHVAVGLHQPPFDLQVAHAAIREPLGIAPRHVGVQRIVEVRDLTLVRTAAIGQEQFRGLGHRRGDVRHHRRRIVHRHVRRATASADQLRRYAAIQVRIQDRGATADRRGEAERAGREPCDLLRLVLPCAQQVLRHTARNIDDINARRLRTRRTTDERHAPAVRRPLQVRLATHPLRDLARCAAAHGHHVDVRLVALCLVTHLVVRQRAQRITFPVYHTVGAKARIGHEGHRLPVGRDHRAAMRVHPARDLHLGRVADRLPPELRRSPVARRATAGDEPRRVGLEVHVREMTAIEARGIGRHRDRLERRTCQCGHLRKGIPQRSGVHRRGLGPHGKLSVAWHRAARRHRRHLHCLATRRIDADHPRVALALRPRGIEQQVAAIRRPARRAALVTG